MLPYPGMPYGYAPSWCFPLFECSMYLLFLWCFVHAVQKWRQGISFLLGGLAFGLILEYIEVISHSYTYGHFIIMIGSAPMDIPLCIGAGWGIIMYTGRLFADRIGLSLWASAALITLLALNIDMSMDTVAYRLHMWNWNWTGTGLNPLTAQWFGIPYGNFIGWQTVVFCYTLFSGLFERVFLGTGKKDAYRYALIAFCALLCSQAVLYSTETWIFPALANYFHVTSGERLVIFTLIFIALIARGWRRKKSTGGALPAVAWWVPGWFHLFFFSCFFIFGFYKENVWMTVAATANIIIGIAGHVWPLSVRQKQAEKRVNAMA
jgi:hypothetical protein